MSDIGEYYQRKAEASRRAWEKYREAQQSGASAEELHRLYEAACDAGDCGD